MNDEAISNPVNSPNVILILAEFTFCRQAISTDMWSEYKVGKEHQGIFKCRFYFITEDLNEGGERKFKKGKKIWVEIISGIAETKKYFSIVLLKQSH